MEALITNLIEHAPYLGVLFVLLLAGVGVPLPEDLPLLTGGWLVHRGHAALMPMISIGLIGVLSGDLLIFYMGRRYGVHIVEHRWLRRMVAPAVLARAQAIFARHGEKIIFAARFMPGLRAVIFAVAGIFKVKPLHFIAIDGAAALASVPLLVWLGWRFGKEMERLVGDVHTAQMIVLGVLATALVLWGLWEYRVHVRRKRLGAASGDGLPPHDVGRAKGPSRPGGGPPPGGSKPGRGPAPSAVK